HRQQRMQQHAVMIALADRPQPASALRRGVEVDFAGVLRVSERMCKQVSVSLPYRGDSHDDRHDDYT
ncbi:hypothetical protein, partial [Bradyrhizobium sp. LeoA1S1]